MSIDWTYNRKYTDKFREDVATGHFFVDVYKEVLPPAKRILEIGTQQGGFIKFCKDQLDVFFVGADLHTKPVYGANYWVDDQCFNDMADDFYEGDAFTDEFLKWIGDKEYARSFDLVIDDGPHTLQSQVWLISKADFLLSPTGVFVCEDIQSPEYAQIIMAASPFPEDTWIWDNSKVSGRWDDICVIIDRRDG